MDNLLTEISKQYEELSQTYKDKDNKNTINEDGISKINIANFIKASKNCDNNSAVNLSSLPLDKFINIIKSTPDLQSSYFANSLYQNLGQKELLTLTESVCIPSIYHKFFFSFIIKNKKIANKLVLAFVQKNSAGMTEEMLLVLWTNKYENKENVITFVIENIDIDIEYMHSVISGNQSSVIGKEEGDLLIECLSNCKKVCDGWYELANDINLILYWKKEIGESEYNDNVGKIRKTKENTTIVKEGSFDVGKEFDLGWLEKIKNRNMVMKEKIYV